MKKLLLSNLISTGIFLVIIGCSASQNSVILQPTTDVAQVPAAYRVQPGDTLDIKFFYNPELNELVQVRPDGYISLQLIEEIKAAGMEPKELSRQLAQAYAKDLRKPVVTVIVKTFEGQRVYVGGEVTQQGIINMPTGLTALQAVMQAGGFKNTAHPEETIVIRKGPDRSPVPIRVNLATVLNGEQGGLDLRLQPEDVIFVPKSSIAKANLFVNQYIEQLLLFRGVSFGFSYNINDGNN